MVFGDQGHTGRHPSGLSECRSSGSKKSQANKDKAGASKKMVQAEQSERFIDTARELCVDDTADEFEKVFQLSQS